MAYLPPYEVLKDGLGASPDGELVVMSHGLFRTMIGIVAKSTGFDPVWYRQEYPDVAEGIGRGDFADELDHFVQFGYMEGRMPCWMAVDEYWYRDAYPDVDDAVIDGRHPDGDHHFNEIGFLEGRVPDAASEDTIVRWRNAVAQSRQALMLANDDITFLTNDAAEQSRA
jgi:hypothetical protein